MSLNSSSTIIQIETANPPLSLSQQEVLSIVKEVVDPPKRSMDLYQKFLSDPGIDQRYFACDDPKSLLKETVDEKMNRFEHWAVELAVEAAQKALQKQGCKAKDIEAIFVCTCTGYLCPGLSTYVSQALGSHERIYTLDLVGLGCAGAIPAIRAADDYLRLETSTS